MPVETQGYVKYLAPPDRSGYHRLTPNRLYRWWLYRGPGLKGLRRILRSGEEVLPPGFEFVDSNAGGFSGSQAIEAEHAVEELREKLDDYDFERDGLKVKIVQTVHQNDAGLFI